MTTWSHGVCDANGIQVHYVRTGARRRSIVMLHGLMGSSACWAPVARALETEFDVVMPDARGHGGSSAPERGYRYDDLARDVFEVMRGLQLEQPVVLGHSMGGMTAAVVAQRWPGAVSGVVLVDPTFLSADRQREVHASDVAEQHRRALASSKSALIEDARARHPHRALELIEALADARLKTSLAAFEVLTPPNPDYRDVVAAFEVPALLVIGDQPVVTLDVARELQRIQPRLRVEQIGDAGHGLPYDQPARLADVVASFLRPLASA